MAKISLGLCDDLRIGNLSSERDWGYAPEYVDAIMRIMNHKSPDDFVVASGALSSVRDFVTLAFAVVGITLAFEGEGLGEAGFDQKTGKKLVSVEAGFYRDSEEMPLLGNPAKIELALGWKAKTSLSKIISEMVEHDLDGLQGV